MAEQQTTDESTADSSSTWAEISQMLELRRELAQAEIKHDLAVTRRLAVAGGCGIVAVLTALPVLVTVAATELDRHFQLGFPGVAVGIGLSLLAGGVLIGWSAWRRFRYEFLGLRESREELQEDLIWLRERFEK